MIAFVTGIALVLFAAIATTCYAIWSVSDSCPLTIRRLDDE